jgi:hypothetical protein
MQNTSSGTSLGAQVSNAVFYLVPGSQWAWNAMSLFFTMITGYLSLATDLINAFSVAGFPAGWLAFIIGVTITAFVGLEILGWMGKYKLQ